MTVFEFDGAALAKRKCPRMHRVSQYIFLIKKYAGVGSINETLAYLNSVGHNSGAAEN